MLAQVNVQINVSISSNSRQRLGEAFIGRRTINSRFSSAGTSTHVIFVSFSMRPYAYPKKHFIYRLCNLAQLATNRVPHEQIGRQSSSVGLAEWSSKRRGDLTPHRQLVLRVTRNITV